MSPTLAAEAYGPALSRPNKVDRQSRGLTRSILSGAPVGQHSAYHRTPRFAPEAGRSSPMASILLDPQHQPSSTGLRKQRRHGTQSGLQSSRMPLDDPLEDDEEALWTMLAFRRAMVVRALEMRATLENLGRLRVRATETKTERKTLRQRITIEGQAFWGWSPSLQRPKRKAEDGCKHIASCYSRWSYACDTTLRLLGIGRLHATLPPLMLRYIVYGRRLLSRVTNLLRNSKTPGFVRQSRINAQHILSKLPNSTSESSLLLSRSCVVFCVFLKVSRWRAHSMFHRTKGRAVLWPTISAI